MSTETAQQGQDTTATAVPALQLRDVTSGYGRTTVLRGIDLTVGRGTIDALIGSNGAGKTTLLRTAAGLLKPTAGEIRLGDEDVTGRSPHDRARAGLCLIPEGRGIFRNLSVRENLGLWIPKGAKDVEIDRALDVFPVLRDRLGQSAGTLSGGEQQMVALARCFLAGPSVVLLDEVSMGLAPKIVDEIFAALLRLAAEGISLLLVEQYVNRALEMADRAHVLVRGSISFSGNAADLDEDSVVREYLGAPIQADGAPRTDSQP
jgi:branched-chain amino acid transport system ATP-binding protein